ncbi:MAG TPA: ATP-binding protein [Povalibacter sp.]|uniref:ATP-binding protein n=1 Tax=Povalibacter sp. TaxID=1962978 RepID=UPI002B5C82E8|nr:ATP-binding protein [Povalibacter sp.]HMN46049.1 ATP-binding protein [Povalibacter sp.]
MAVSGNPDRSTPVFEQTRRFEQARLRLARLDAGGEVPLHDLWLQLARCVVEALDIDRIGVWVLVDEGRALRCRYLFQRSSGQVFQGAVLRQQDFPRYFEALQALRTLPATHAGESTLTGELSASYLQPLGITSLLDAPLYIEGRVVGVVCHEHIGAPREWSGAESDFASAVADNIARLYQEHRRRSTRATLDAYEDHLMELHRMEAVGRMAAGIAHDFRGILGAAMGFAELIQRVPGLPADADRYSQKIVEILQRGNNLTNEVVSFGKDAPVSPRVIDVARTIQSMHSMFQVLLGNRIRLTSDVDRPISRVFIDSAQLERTLLNLVLNARDAMPAGGELAIRAEDIPVEDEDGESGVFVEISVTDTGIGMDEETRENIFRPFFTTKGEHGTGLGCAIVHQIVTRAGGLIRIDSTPGMGTKVSLYLPRIAAAEEAPPVGQASA